MVPSATDPQLANDPPIASDILHRMVKDFFDTMVGLPIEPISESDATDGCDCVQSSVRVSGDWSAHVVVTATRALATDIACAMFDLRPSNISEDEILDAIGEAANILGGNIKSEVGGTCELSIPRVGLFEYEDSDAFTEIFRCNDQFLRLIIRPIAN
ncbi:MAG: chemotaxis protein CheX [Planctomycetota bacterium]